MRAALPAFLTGLSLLAGCAADLSAVRSFADETKKISLAFDPFLARAVEQCERRDTFRNIYTSSTPLKEFDPVRVAQQATDTCKPLADESAVARELGVALGDYADVLSAIAGDGVRSSVDGNYDAVSRKLGQFKELPQEKVNAVSGLFQFLTRIAISRTQKTALEHALDHEDAVGALSDALVLYSERVYGAYLSDRSQDIEDFKSYIRDGDIPVQELVGRLQLMELQRENIELKRQAGTVAALRKSVEQMKVSLRDLRANLGNLSDSQRRVEVGKLAKEVGALYKQINKAI